jgi:hypothetical protein
MKALLLGLNYSQMKNKIIDEILKIYFPTLCEMTIEYNMLGRMKKIHGIEEKEMNNFL